MMRNEYVGAGISPAPSFVKEASRGQSRFIPARILFTRHEVRFLGRFVTRAPSEPFCLRTEVRAYGID